MGEGIRVEATHTTRPGRHVERASANHRDVDRHNERNARKPSRRSRRHQILWLHEVALPVASNLLARDAWDAEEPEGPVVFRWVRLADLAGMIVRPATLRELVSAPPGPARRIVCDEISRGRSR